MEEDPRPPTKPGLTRYAIFEVLTLKEVQARVESRELPESVQVLIERPSCSGTSPQNAINDYAKSIDKEGRRYKAAAAHYVSELHEPKKETVWR
jgi:hypothetical protein